MSTLSDERKERISSLYEFRREIHQAMGLSGGSSIPTKISEAIERAIGNIVHEQLKEMEPNYSHKQLVRDE